MTTRASLRAFRQTDQKVIRCLFSLLSFFLFAFSASYAQGKAPASLRVALLTDLHINPTNRAAEEGLKRCIQEIQTLGAKVDFVIVAGDLTEKGDEESLRKVRTLFSSLSQPILFVQGNHETKWSQSLATAFGRIFGSERFSKDIGGFRFIGINTAPIIRMMDGHLYPTDLNYLKEQLETMPQGAKAVLVTHYPLLPQDVDNWYEGTHLLRSHPVALVLGGHYHQNRVLYYDGIPGILSRSTLPDASGSSGFTLLDFYTDKVEAFEYSLPGPRISRWATVPLGVDTLQPLAPLPDDSLNEQCLGQLSELWRIRSGTEAYMCPPTVSDTLLVAVDGSGVVRAFGAYSGRLLWTCDTHARVVGAPQAAGDRVVVGNASGSVYCFSLSDGRLLWDLQFSHPVSGAIAIREDTVYVGDTSGAMHAIGLNRGRLLWTSPIGENYIETRPYVDTHRVIFGAWDGCLYAVDRTSGTLLWRWKGPKADMHFSPAAVWPVANDSLVFVTAPDRVVTAVDLRNGATVARYTEDQVRETIALSKDRTRLYSKTMQDKVVCLKPDSSLSLLWRCDVGYGYDHAASMPIEMGNTLIVVTKNGLIGGIDTQSGRKKWLYKIGNTLINTPVRIDDHHFAYTTMSGGIGVIKVY